MGRKIENEEEQNLGELLQALNARIWKYPKQLILCYGFSTCTSASAYYECYRSVLTTILIKTLFQ